MANANEGKVYVLQVTGKLAPGHMEKFLELFRPLAAYVQENEEGAYTYQASVGADDPDKILIYERYVSADYVATVHRNSPAFKEMMAKSKAQGIKWISQSFAAYHERAGFASKL